MVIGALAGFIARRPVVWHLRDIVSKEHFDKHRLAIIKALSKHMITHVIANSRASADALHALADLSPDQVSVVYNGIDAIPFDFAAKIPTAALRARYDLPANAYLIGTFSRLAHWKGQHVLLDALASLPNAHAVLVGAALFGEDAYEAELKAQVQTLGLTERVHFIGFQSDVAGLMHAMDMIVHTSIAPEPFGRVIVEAMLARRPIVAAAGGGALEIITDGVDGVLVTPGDAAALAAAVDHLRHHPEERDAIVLRGYSRARGSFDPDAYCQAVLRRLEAVGQFALPVDNVDTEMTTSVAAPRS
jgi:glycosyltransferase involved in cell wall biosynthesis